MSSIPRWLAASISITSSDVPDAIVTARVARAVGLDGGALLAVQRLCQDARERRLAGAARPGEEIGLPDLIGLDRVPERADDRLLSDDLVEGLRPVFAVERGHASHAKRRRG